MTPILRFIPVLKSERTYNSRVKVPNQVGKRLIYENFVITNVFYETRITMKKGPIVCWNLLKHLDYTGGRITGSELLGGGVKTLNISITFTKILKISKLYIHAM